MANNRHFYGAGVLPRSMAQELEEKLNDMEFWHLLVKPFERLCSVKEACERSGELADNYEEAAEESPDEDVVLFIAEGWGKYGVSDTVDSKTIFLIQTEGDDSYELFSGWDTYTDEDYGFGSYVVSELDENNMFGFAEIDEFLSEIAPDFPKPRFKYLSQEELGDSYSDTMFLSNDPQPSESPMAGRKVLGGDRPLPGMKYLNEEIVSQLSELSGIVPFVFSGGSSSFHAVSTDAEGLKGYNNEEWFEWGDGDIEFLPLPQNDSKLKIGEISVKFDVSDWNCNDSKVKISDGNNIVALWQKGTGGASFDGYFIIDLGEEKFDKDKLTFNTISYYDETETLQKTIVASVSYDGAAYGIVHYLPNGGYSPGKPTWIVPHDFEVPAGFNSPVRKMADPATLPHSEGFVDAKLGKQRTIVGEDMEENEVLEEGINLYEYMQKIGDSLYYDPNKTYYLKEYYAKTQSVSDKRVAAYFEVTDQDKKGAFCIQYIYFKDGFFQRNAIQNGKSKTQYFGTYSGDLSSKVELQIDERSYFNGKKQCTTAIFEGDKMRFEGGKYVYTRK